STTTTKINFTKPANASSYEYRLNGGDPQILRSDSIITGLSSATTYTIEVRARNSAGAGPWSSTVNVTTDTAIGIPGTVVDLAVSTTDLTTATLTFTAAINSASYEYRLNGGVAQTLAGTKIITGLSAA